MIQWNFIPANLNGGMNCLKSPDYQGGMGDSLDQWG